MENSEELKQRYNFEIKKCFTDYQNNIGKEYEEFFSNKLFNLFDGYEKKFGKPHPQEIRMQLQSKVNRGELDATQLKNSEYLKNVGAIEENKRMRELVKLYEKKEEIFKKDKKSELNTDLSKEYKRLSELAGGKLNADFKEGYVQNSMPFEMGQGNVRTVSTIANDMYGNPAMAHQTIRQPLQPDEAVELAITRTLKSGAPVKDMGFYDEVNWHLQTLGFPAKAALDIKTVVLKMMSK